MEKLTNQEEQVMLHVWQLQECAIKDVYDLISIPKPPYTTLASVFNNLEAKGYLTRRKFGNVKVFTPLIDEKVYKSHFLKRVVNNYFSSSYKNLVTFFAEEQKISSEELQEIIRIIKDSEK